MTEPSAGTFAKLLTRKVRDGVISHRDAILVQFAGEYDERVCQAVGLTNCTFANIAPDTHSTGKTVADRFDAHRMPQESMTFDHVIGHSGLHHCSRPHEALHEMYRLARKTVLFVENQDSLMMRAATRAGIVSWFELPAVVDGDYVSGGVDGSGVPNHVYRWTRREVSKAVASFDPGVETPIEFYAEWNIDSGRVSTTTLRNKFGLKSDENAVRLLRGGHALLNGIVAGQGNIFAVTIRKDLATLRPWMASASDMKR